jgi:hypothetical protein
MNLIIPFKDATDLSLISQLEEMLTLAKQEKIKSLVCIMNDKEGCAYRYQYVKKQSDLYVVLGILEQLKFDLLRLFL